MPCNIVYLSLNEIFIYINYIRNYNDHLIRSQKVRGICPVGLLKIKPEFVHCRRLQIELG